MNNLALFDDKTLVFTNETKTESFTTTRAIANYLNLEHKHVLKRLREIIKKSELIGNGVLPIRYKDSRGRTQTEYKIKRSVALRFVIEFDTKDAHEIKDTLVLEFVKMAKYLSTNQEWLKSRIATKVETKTANDTIEDFIKYAEKQRGNPYEGVSPYRLMFHRQISKAVTGTDRSHRDTLPKEYLEIIEFLEEKTSELLGLFMYMELEYHDIAKHTLRHIRLSAAETLKEVNLCRYDARRPKQESLF